MRKTGVFSIVFVVVLLAVAIIAEAQQPTKIPRIGFQFDSPLSAVAARVEGFRQGLRELGYVEGKNIIIEWRSAEGKPERRNEIAADWARLKVDVIVTGGPTTTSAAKEATATIPIVMAFDNDPIGNGFVASLARPGGNITGLSTLAPEISGKQLEILREVVPRLSRVAVLGSSTTPGNAQSLKETELAAGAFAIKVQFLNIQNPQDIETSFRAAGKGRADSILVLTSPIVNPYRTEIADLAIRNRLPAMYSTPEFVEDGGLMTYGVSIADLYRRAATYVDKILKGAKPADLPVEQPKKFEFIINLKAAKQIA